MKSQRILVFGMSSHFGGVESFIMNYYRNIDHQKIQFDFLTYDEKPAYHEEIEALGGHIFVIPGRRKNFLKCIASLNQIFKEIAYSVVWSNLCYMSDLLVLECAKRAKVPVRIIHAHNSMNMSSKLNGLLHMQNRRRIEKLATDFWACSNIAGRFFYPEAILHSNRYCVINNAIDARLFTFDGNTRSRMRQQLGLENRWVIGNVGRFHEQKNHLFLLDIFSELHKKRPESFLLLVGDGERRNEITQKAAELGLRDHLRMVGNRSDVYDLMQMMDVFVLPSLYEGLGIVLIEAQAAGLKCFTSADTVPKEAQVTDLLSYIPLQESAEYWAAEIVAGSSYTRENQYEQIVKKGYDIRKQAQLLEAFFEKEGSSV